MMANLMGIKKFRKIADTVHQNHKNLIVGSALEVLRSGYEKIRKEKEDLMNNFLNHCAITIQKNWRGYKFRRNELPAIARVRMAEETFKAFIKAWRLRKVM